MGIFEICLFIAIAMVVYIVVNKARSCGFISNRWFGGSTGIGSKCHSSDSEHSPSELVFDDDDESD
jgi:hypothetical protein